MSAPQVGDILNWSLLTDGSGTSNGSNNWWYGHRLYCKSTGTTKDVWTRADNVNGTWVDGGGDGIAYYHGNKQWQDENTAAAQEPHTTTGYSVLGGTSSQQQATNPPHVKIQITNLVNPSHIVWITNPYYTAVTWSVTGRQLSATFPANQLTTYEFVEVSGSTPVVHHTKYYGAGATGVATETFVADTYVPGISEWYIREFGANAGTYIGGGSAYVAQIAPAVPTATATNVYRDANGVVTYHLTGYTGFPGLTNWYDPTTVSEKDVWQIVAKDVVTNAEVSSTGQHLTGTSANTITFNGFAGNDYNNKFIRVQIRNTAHDANGVLAPWNDLQSSSGNFQLTSPFSAPSPSIATTVANWNQSGATVTIPVTVSNFGANDKAELWVGGVYNSHTTISGNLTYNFTQTTASTVFEVKYNDGTNVTSLNPAKTNSYSYNAGSLTTSNYNWTDDLWNGGSTVSCTFYANNTQNTAASVYLKRSGISGSKDDIQIPANTTGTYTLSDTTSTVITYYIGHSLSGTNQESSYLNGSNTGTQPYVFTFGSWDTSVTNQVRATFTQSNPTGSETVTLTHPTDSNKNVTVDHLQTEVTFIMTGTADDGTYSIGAQQQSYAFYTAPAPPPPPPASSSTPSGGGIKRYPMILTQLFNKKRSFYSIGLTHKDGQLDCFL